MTNTKDLKELALLFHRRVPERIKEHLTSLGISMLAIHRYRIGWNGLRVTIPITNRKREVTFFVLLPDPASADREVKVQPHSGAELFGWERLAFQPDELVICEHEIDRLVLESFGIPAVCPSGTDEFDDGWASAFQAVPSVAICFGRSTRGARAASRIARLISHARIVDLPETLDPGATISDFFVRLGNGREDFINLLASARRPDDDAEPVAA